MDQPIEQFPLPGAGTVAAYVVLHHSGIPEPHFDLMLQFPGIAKLATWRIEASPQDWPRLDAERIGDHRAVYMSYQGPLSDNRGTVVRIEEGTASILPTDGTAFRVRLHRPRPVDLSLPPGGA
jgi:hypothetical protein